jgi:ABC-type multidrug transport system ATPase subunit
VLALLGPNGAGKTTAFNLLLGLLPASAGAARVLGHEVTSPAGAAAARPRTGVCPQFDVLWGSLSPLEHLRLFAAIKGLPAAAAAGEARRRLEEVRLGDAADRPAAALSGGMRRRLSVAAALMGGPRVVFLDEPTTGMDPVSRRQARAVLRACVRAGVDTVP